MTNQIPEDTKVEAHAKLAALFNEYLAEAEEHEDEDVLTSTSTEDRINDFAMWLYHVRGVVYKG